MTARLLTCALALSLTACGPALPAPTGALSAASGTLVWLDAKNPALRLQGNDGSGWATVEADARAGAFGTWWWIEGAAPGLRYRLVEGRKASTATTADPFDIVFTRAPAHGAVLTDEPLTLQVDGPLPDLPLEVYLSLDGAPLSPSCLSGGALLGCIDDGAEPLLLDAPWSAAVWAAPGQPQRSTLSASIGLEDVTLGAFEEEVLLLGRQMMWGDLHAHSGLSHDGCEDPDADCATREPDPGAEFFALAAETGLDFAAMTEHAELNRYISGDVEETIWAAQQAAVQAADGVVAVLGYEWTYVRPDLPGGHKTVLLEEAESCDSRRLSSAYETDVVTSPSGARYMESNAYVAIGNEELWAQLASADCPGSGRALTFAHHPAWTPPEMVDWTDPVNDPDPDFEPVVEIHSEHASSECADLSAEGCDWGIAPDRTHHPEGAVQTALLQGHRLGFVGGTDSHDARPGSVEDGPSCVGRVDDKTGELFCHTQDGALTGIFAGPGDLDRAALFDHLFARETAATSGPRPPLRVALVTADGEAHLPGAVVDAGEASIYVSMDEADLDGLEVIEAALITPDNQHRAWTDTLPAVLPVTLASEDTAYLRLRLWDPEAGAEQRLWLSPWFTDGK